MASRAYLDHGTVRGRLDLALGRELEHDERVFWQGMQLARLNPKTFAIFLFAVPWTGFALFWTAMAFLGATHMKGDGGAGWLAYAFPLFGTPFIAVGVGMLSVPFLPLWERGKVLYVVTSRRVLKLRLGRELSVQSIPKERIGSLERTEGRSGEGSLKIPIAIGKDSDGDRTTEHFELGIVADIMGAQRALYRLIQV